MSIVNREHRQPSWTSPPSVARAMADRPRPSRPAPSTRPARAMADRPRPSVMPERDRIWLPRPSVAPERKRAKREALPTMKYHCFYPQRGLWKAFDYVKGVEVSDVIIRSCEDVFWWANNEEILVFEYADPPPGEDGKWGQWQAPRRNYKLGEEYKLQPGHHLLVWMFPPIPERPPPPGGHRPFGAAAAASSEMSPPLLAPAARDSVPIYSKAAPEAPPNHLLSRGSGDEGVPREVEDPRLKGLDDLPSIEAPQCQQCFGHIWPVHRNKKGNYNCSNCSVPKTGRPICIWCDKSTWDGMSTGATMCSKGKFFICRECWITHAQPPGATPEQWSEWFKLREAKFPEAFKDGGPAAPSGGDSAEVGASSSAAAAGSAGSDNDVKMTSFAWGDDPTAVSPRPPKCTSCSQQIWPAMKAKSGKWHCGFCRPPPDGRPACSKCGDLSWDGLSPRGAWLAKGELFICRACWTKLDWHWEYWFLDRSDQYPEVYTEEGGPHITKDDKPTEGFFSLQPT